MEIRPVDPSDRQALLDFANSVPERDKSFGDRTLFTQVAIAGWTQAVPERRLVAVDDDGTVAGIMTLVPGVGWTSHVGDLRVVVLPEYRGQGIGWRLAAAGQELAETLGMSKLMIEITATNSGGQAMFRAFGFAEEARLHGHVRDLDGEPQDLLLFSRWLDGSNTGHASE
jgi:ribosomal protein S18 acetylase RimI-like enzyme